MDIVIHKSCKEYLKNKLKEAGYTYKEEDIIHELACLLENYNNKIYKRIIIIKSEEWYGNNWGAIKIASSYIIDYITGGEKKEFYGKCILECIGHELGHDNVMFYFPLFPIVKACIKNGTSKDKFIARLIEVYCDHYSLEFTEFDDEIHKKIMEEHIRKLDSEVKTDFYHPTWMERSKYILEDFSENLIKQIAIDNGFKNEKVILDMINYYKDVKRLGGSKKTKYQMYSYIRLLFFVSYMALIFFVFIINWFKLLFSIIK